jgi:trehalose-6-phosphate synthase
VLILSEMAGASRELGEAITINPATREEIASALESALEMPPDEQARRLGTMQDRLRKHDVRRWAREFLGRLENVRSDSPAASSAPTICAGWSRSTTGRANGSCCSITTGRWFRSRAGPTRRCRRRD